MLWVFVILAIVAGGIGIAKWLQKRQERKNNENHTDMDSINYG
jgi:cytochrome c-type biogenesis protein CcmH/NrfF